MSPIQSATRRIIGAVSALAIGLGAMAATALPARADGRDVAKVLAGVAAIAIIGSALNNKGHAQPEPVWHPTPSQPPRHGWHQPQPPRPPVMHHKPKPQHPHYQPPRPRHPHYQPPQYRPPHGHHPHGPRPGGFQPPYSPR